MSYEGWKDIVSREFFMNNHINELSVAIGKGLISEELLKAYFAKFTDYLFE